MPLKLTRVGTVYSFTQLEETGTEVLKLRPSDGDRSKEVVREICGSLIPLYQFPAEDGLFEKRIRSFGDFQRMPSSMVPDVDEPMPLLSDEDTVLEGSSDSGSSSQVVPQRSILDNLMLAEWEDRADQGLFRYDVTACPSRVMSGMYGFIAQLNEGRASKKRPTEFCVDQVNQPFDDSKFNFGKALQREVLFQFEGSSCRHASFTPAAVAENSPSLVMINVSPIEYGHVLLVPKVLENLNQCLGPETLLLALQFAREANNPYFRVGFNSLGAYATINHLHFQAYYLAAPMPIERAPTESLHAMNKKSLGKGKDGCKVRVLKITNYPVRALVFEAGSSLSELASKVGMACEWLTEQNIPHNVLIVDRGARIFLIPNGFAERKARGELPDGKQMSLALCSYQCSIKDD